MNTKTFTIEHATPIVPTTRTAQVAGMFDLFETATSREKFAAEIPTLEDTWQIGLIVGASGSGKTSIAREMYKQLYTSELTAWDEEKAIIDGFPAHLPIKQITSTLTAVGFSSPPSWLKPYRVLSGGERMRADLARALLDPPTSGPVVYDEFTSVIDRGVAQICSAALAKAIRAKRFPADRFVAVSCHYDIAQWLEPDWIFDTADGRLSRRKLRRPTIELTLHPTPRASWDRFKRHHYLTNTLHHAARCYLAKWNRTEVAFVATLTSAGVHGVRRISRIVTLPDFQGVGIGAATLKMVAAHEAREGKRITITTSHPAMINHCNHSPDWRCMNYRPFTVKQKQGFGGNLCRCTAAFEFRPIPVASHDPQAT